MAVGLKNFSTTAATNASADSNINWAENQAPSTVNDSSRAEMAALAAFYDQIGGALTVGGSSNAYTITNATPGTWNAYANGDIIMMKANHTNSGAATLNVDGLGAKSIKTADGNALLSGDIVSGGFYLLSYDGTNFQIVNSAAPGSYQPLDATLTAIAALTLDGTNSYIRATGADTFTADTIATFTATLGAMVGDSGSGGTKGLVPAPASGDTAANKFLKASGAWVAPVLARSRISSNTTAVAGYLYEIDCSAAAVTLTLPSSPSDGDLVSWVDTTMSANDYNITISGTIQGTDGTLVVQYPYPVPFTLVWKNASSHWRFA